MLKGRGVLRRNSKNIFSIFFILVASYFITIALKDDVKEIEKAFSSMNQPLTTIAHIKVLDNNKAIVFYKTQFANIEYFGNARLKKNIFGWKLVSSSSGQSPNDSKLGWHFSNLEFDFPKYTDLLSGEILDSEITDVVIVTKNNKEYHAEIIEYNSGERFWYLVTDGEDLLGSTVSGLTSDGKVVEQITM
ncbi:hypothetical protein [Sporosarcina luteola]|uniref:hypothetical protein n=1 Tax=Sporosarcina luteola TaxID=582850 RepID=UPI00203BEFFF|nr:hypothetical protein [Sporosarcina luteola]MCM3711137.1 hypothetical protein [Sporosarcina luteola]